MADGKPIEEIHPGVFHWKAVHPKLQIEVSSYLLADSATAIDPLLPPAGGLDALREPGEPQRVVLTNRHHLRQAPEIASEVGCPILCHEAGLHEFEGGPEVEGFDFGEELAPGVVAHEVGVICPEETALHIASGGGLLAVADGVINYDGLRFVPDHLLGDDPEAIKQGLRGAYARLCDLEFEVILCAHGDPVLEGGQAALRDFTRTG